MGTTGPSFKAQNRGSRLPGSGVPRCACPREESLNSGSVSWVPSCPRPDKLPLIRFLSHFSFPRVRWRGLGETLSEAAAHFSPSSYYSKKQRSLRLNASWKGQSRSRSRCGRGRSGRSHAGLAFFCQAARLIGLSNAELARSLHGLRKAGAPGAGRGPAELGTLSHNRFSGRAPPFPSTRFLAPGACSPYSQIPSLNGGPQPESHTQSRTPRPDVRLPKSYQPSRPKRGPKSGRLSQGESRHRQGQWAGPGYADKGQGM